MKTFAICLFLVGLTLNSHAFAFTFPKLSLKRLLEFGKFKVEDILNKAGGNTQCAKDLKHLAHDAVFAEKWALRMLDASGKFPSGMLNGHAHSVGSFDECVDIREVKKNSVIDGQYCSVVVVPSAHFSNEFSLLLDAVALTNYVGINVSYQTANVLKKFRMTYGACIPKSCSMENLQGIWDYVEHTFRMPFHMHFANVLCRYRDKPVEPYDFDVYVYAAFGIYMCILLISTCYDLMVYQNLEEKKKPFHEIWISFSVYTNAKKLFSYNKTDNRDHLQCVSGIKVLSILWIIYGHRMLMNAFVGNVNSFYIFQLLAEYAPDIVSFIPALNIPHTHKGWKWHSLKSVSLGYVALMRSNKTETGAFLAVDSFFLLSGLLLSYGYLSYKSIFKAKIRQSIPLTAFYGLRFLRLSPALLATVLFYTSCFKTLSDGPLWPIISKKFASSCRNTWWATIFFFSNVFQIQHQCVEQSWYLAVDTQLYIVSPVILLNLEKNPSRTCLACLGACVVSAVYAFWITVKNNYALLVFDGNGFYQQYIYTSTFVRMPPWIIGIVLGYLVFKYKKISIPQGTNLFIWFTAMSLMAYIVLMHAIFTRSDYNVLTAAVYNSCVRPLWALALATTIFSCVTGHGGVINAFLSLPIFQVLVRLNYAMYLVHLAVLTYFIGGKRNLDHFSNVKGIHDFMGDLFFIFVVSIVWVLAFESPFMAIGKTVLSNHKGNGNEIVPRKKKNKNYMVCVYDGAKEFKKHK